MQSILIWLLIIALICLVNRTRKEITYLLLLYSHFKFKSQSYFSLLNIIPSSNWTMIAVQVNVDVCIIKMWHMNAELAHWPRNNQRNNDTQGTSLLMSEGQTSKDKLIIKIKSQHRYSWKKSAVCIDPSSVSNDYLLMFHITITYQLPQV